MPPKRKTPIKKPPAKTKLEQEAEEFKRSKRNNTTEMPEELPLSTLRYQLAASVLSGLLARGVTNRAEELVVEAFKYADLILRDNNTK